MLAKVCAERGAPQLTASVLMNIESGRRSEDGRRRRHVTVDEVMALAYVLEVSPMALLLPGEDTSYRITDEDTVPARTVYEWLVGELLPPFPFPLEGITDEDRARAWYAFRSLVGYVPEASAHWLVRAELERMKERERRLVAEAKLREAMDTRRGEQRSTESVLIEMEDRLKHLRMQLDKARHDVEEQGASDELRLRCDRLEEQVRHAQSELRQVQIRHHALTHDVDSLSVALKELNNGANDGGR